MAAPAGTVSPTLHRVTARDADTRTEPVKPPDQELLTVKVAVQPALVTGGVVGGVVTGAVVVVTGGVVTGGVVTGGVVTGGVVTGGVVTGAVVGGIVVPLRFQPELESSQAARWVIQVFM